MRSVFKSKSLSLAVGILFAAVGFSYALATSSVPDSDAGARENPRVAGTNPRLPLAFTVPFLSGSSDRDLGDAAIGSTITRYIHARGGYPPHRFTSDRTLIGADGQPVFKGTTTLGEAEIALPSSAKPTQSTTAVYLTGLLKGVIGGAGGTVPSGTPLRFDTTVEDSRNKTPNSVTETFRITLVDSSAFKFAQSSLNSGVAFRRYYEKLEVVAGNGPYTFTASNITVTNGGVATSVAQFADIGLFLNAKNGMLVGRPLLAGTVSFLADCVDSKGAHAASRNKTGVGQVINFNVDANNRVASELFALKMSIKGDTKTGGKDTVSYQGVLALGSYKVSDLNGLGVTLMIGNYLSPTVSLTGGKGTSGGMTVLLGSDGSLKISIKSESFGTAGTIIINSELANVMKILPVSVVIGSDTDNAKPAYQSSELLRFGVKAKSSKFDLEYKFGPGNLGGGFIITSVAGKDDKPETGDAWAVKFISLPPNAQKLSSFGTIASTTVGIGTDFTNSIPSVLNGTKVASTEKRTSGAVILKVGYDSTSGKGFVNTGTLPQLSTLPNTATNIPPALNANGKNSPFPFLIAFTDANGKELFGAEGSRRISPKGTQWVTKDLGK